MLPSGANGNENEVLLGITDLTQIWTTSHGSMLDSDPIGNLSNWFSLVKQEGGGGISRVYYPRRESRIVLAFKKSLSQLLSVGGAVERNEGVGGVHVIKERDERAGDQGTVAIVKVSKIQWSLQ